MQPLLLRLPPHFLVFHRWGGGRRRTLLDTRFVAQEPKGVSSSSGVTATYMWRLGNGTDTGRVRDTPGFGTENDRCQVGNVYFFIQNVHEFQLFYLRHREEFMEVLRPTITFFAFYMKSGKRTRIKCYGIVLCQP